MSRLWHHFWTERCASSLHLSGAFAWMHQIFMGFATHSTGVQRDFWVGAYCARYPRTFVMACSSSIWHGTVAAHAALSCFGDQRDLYINDGSRFWLLRIPLWGSLLVAIRCTLSVEAGNFAGAIQFSQVITQRCGSTIIAQHAAACMFLPGAACCTKFF